MNTALRGSAAEMLVAADLMVKGFEVFHGISGREAFDLIAVDVLGRRMWRIEVKAGMQVGLLNLKRVPPWDVLAIAHVDDRVVEYIATPEDFVDACGEVDRQNPTTTKGLTAQIRELMRRDMSRWWSPREVADALHVDARDCRERMRHCPLMDRNEATGKYLLIR